MTSNKKSKSTSKKKTAAKKSSTKKKASTKKKTGTRKKAAKKVGAKKTSSPKAASGSGNMPPAELFDGPTAQQTRQMAGTAVAEPWQESEQDKSSLPDLMARSITENLDARPAPSETLDTSATTAGSPTWRAFQASTRKPTGLVGRSLAAVWNFVVALLGAPPPARAG